MSQNQNKNEPSHEKKIMDPVELKNALIERYDENELRELCFDLRISYDDLSGDNRRTKIVSLIEYCDRRKCLDELEQKVQLALVPSEPPPEQAIEKNTIPDTKPAKKYHWFILGGIGILVVIGIFYSIYSWMNRPPVFTMPPPDLPKTSLILSTNFVDCLSTVNYLPTIDKNLDELEQAFDRTVEAKPVNDLETAVAQSEILETLVIIAGECVTQNSQVVTVTLLAKPAYSYALLQEPSEITVTTHPDHIPAIVNATALYAVGQYEAARNSLQDTMAALPQTMQDDQSATIYWLWGNILAHLGQSEEAIEAYKEAQTVLGEQNTMDQADLLANISLMTYFASRQQKEKFLGLCRQLGTDRIESALEIAPERADLHVIQGLIFLDCPRNDQDIEKNALLAAESALTINKNYAPALTLMADVLSSNMANTSELGSVKQRALDNACLGVDALPSYPDAYRVLGDLYRTFGLQTLAKEQYQLFGELAVFQWQKEEAVKLWQNPPPFVSEIIDISC